MTEPLPPLTDEDLSAVLDGEAGPEVVARVQADPAARARMDAFRAAGDALRQAPVVPPDGGTVDDLIGRALAEADQAAGTPDDDADQDDQDDQDGSTAVLTPLASPRGRRGAPRWLVAATIVALVAVGLGLVWSGRGTEGGDVAQRTAGGSASSQEYDAESGGGAGRGDASDPADPSASGKPVPGDTTAAESSPSPAADDAVDAPLPDLGTFATFEALRESLRISFPEPTPETRTSPGTSPGLPSVAQVDRCDTQMQQVFDIPGGPTDTGIATVDGETVLVFEYARDSFADAQPTTFVTVVSPEACTAELSFERRAG